MREVVIPKEIKREPKLQMSARKLPSGGSEVRVWMEEGGMVEVDLSG